MASVAASNDKIDNISLRLAGVKGDGMKVDDVFVYGQVSNCSEHIIYFGGDVQDYPENMERHRDNKRYVTWNSENTAALIHRKFPSSLVFVIKPSKMHLLTFAVYSNFIETNDFGSPVHSSDHGAIRHLSCLYNAAVKEVNSRTGGSIQPSCPLRLIGFSKGCTVLNQLVFELHLLDQNPQLKQFIKKIKAFYWLDGGHSGGKDNTWITDDEPLRHLASLDSEIYIHVTPYQINDPLRKWIGQQEAKFCKKLKGFNARVVEKVHFGNEPGSINNHFKVLEAF
ncbi:unnamed protein product [Candidula unifasciata]|uniref:Uncharacterized protein n=1 Tax=Candidula unifasciata TaxID=100452 RepID=A0A8S3Z6Y4_9EUPU|nr:unnamed protein product [Candidula unifasciata]